MLVERVYTSTATLSNRALHVADGFVFFSRCLLTWMAPLLRVAMAGLCGASNSGA